jgi:hypothetical protein
MIRKIRLSGLSIAVCLAVPAGFGLAPVFADEATETDPQAMQSEFRYSDDWAIVSAPPPPGPYNSVNLDPRIPGQEGNIHPDMGIQMPSAMSDDRIADEMVAAPPAAGQPAIETRPPARAARQTPYHAPPGYGYGSRMPARTRPAWSMAPRTRNYPPTGWADPGSGSGAAEEEVPPPPVYDRMIGTPPGPYGYGSGRY